MVTKSLLHTHHIHIHRGVHVYYEILTFSQMSVSAAASTL